jgi:hypothetical protein
VGAEGERFRPGERDADEHGPERDARDQARGGGADEERAREQDEAAQQLEGAVEGE